MAVQSPAVLSRERDLPRWFLLFVALTLLAGVVGLFHWMNQRDIGQRIAGNPAALGEAGPVRKLTTIITEPVKGNLIGRQVHLEDVTVSKVVGDYTFWVIDAKSDKAVPVVLRGELAGRQRESQVDVNENQTLRVFGTILPLKKVERIDEEWAIDEQERKRLADEPVYISASRVIVVSR